MSEEVVHAGFDRYTSQVTGGMVRKSMMDEEIKESCLGHGDIDALR